MSTSQDKTPYDLIYERVLFHVLILEHPERVRREIRELFACELNVPPEILAVTAQSVSALMDRLADGKTLPEITTATPFPLQDDVPIPNPPDSPTVVTLKDAILSEIRYATECNEALALKIYEWLRAIVRVDPLILPGYHVETIRERHLLLHKAQRSFVIQSPTPRSIQL